MLLSIMLFANGINIIAMEPQKTCDVCLEDKSIYDFAKPLSCCGYNKSCADCLIGVINTSLQEKTTANIKCPNRDCAQPISKQDIHTLNPDLFKLFCDIAAQEYLTKHEKNIKQCPTPNCTYQFINDYNVKQKYACPSCKHVYCSHCLVRHAPEMTCEQAKKIRELSENHDQANQETQEWIKSNTKQCPKCNKLIQKNGGCNHMTCKQCRHQFCWSCLATYGSTACNSSVCERIFNQRSVNQAEQGDPNMNVNGNQFRIPDLLNAARRREPIDIPQLPNAQRPIHIPRLWQDRNDNQNNNSTPLQRLGQQLGIQNNNATPLQRLGQQLGIQNNNATPLQRLGQQLGINPVVNDQQEVVQRLNPIILIDDATPLDYDNLAHLNHNIENTATGTDNQAQPRQQAPVRFQPGRNLRPVVLDNPNQAVNHNALNQAGQGGNNARTTLQRILDQEQEREEWRNFIQELTENGADLNQDDIDLLNLEQNQPNMDENNPFNSNPVNNHLFGLIAEELENHVYQPEVIEYGNAARHLLEELRQLNNRINNQIPEPARPELHQDLDYEDVD